MTTFIFDVTAFRMSYPEFSDPSKYPDATLQSYWNTATCIISANNYGRLKNDCRLNALNLMTAHLAKIAALTAAGQTPFIVSGSTIDKISVTLLPPPVKTEFRWWLFTTVYGQQYYAIVSSVTAGGFYSGSLPERAAFRSVGGIFPVGGLGSFGRF